MKKSTFFKRLIDLEMMNENGGISLQLKDVKDWPPELDIENWEIDSVSPGDEDDEKGEGYISGYAGGDWQDMTRFTILIPASGKPYCKLFDDPGCFAGKDIYKKLKSLVKKELKENHYNSYFGQYYKKSPDFVRVPSEYEDAYEWVFAKIADGTYWKSNGDSIENPFDHNSESISEEENYSNFSAAKHDWNTITDMCYCSKKNKKSDAFFTKPRKAFKYYSKYRDAILDQLIVLGYDGFTDEMEAELQRRAALSEAQFKTKKRKVARSYEERKRLANRKRFDEAFGE